MRISDWSSDVCSSDLSSFKSSNISRACCRSAPSGSKSFSLSCMVTSDFIRRVMICRLPIPSVSGHLDLYRPVYRRMVNHPLASFDRGFTAIWDRRRRKKASHCSRHLHVVKIELNGPGFEREQGYSNGAIAK